MHLARGKPLSRNEVEHTDIFAGVGALCKPGHESLRSSGVDQQANPVGFFLGFCPAHLQQLPFRIRCSEPCNSRPSVGQARKP